MIDSSAASKPAASIGVNMTINNIKDFLAERNFRPIEVNLDRLSLYYQDKEEGYYALLLFDCPRGDEFTSLQYMNIKRQIYEKLTANTVKRVFLHSVILSENISGASRISERETDSWIIETSGSRLILYENQRYDFAGIRKELENSLLKDYIPEEEQSTRVYHENTFSRYFSLVNTGIVLLNVLVFVVVNNLLSVRTENYLISKGALSWREILDKGEYYRLATYMFLHSGPSHLINNMIVLLFIGDNLERAMGKWKYLLTYLASGLLAGIVSAAFNFFKYNDIISIGASGAIFGVVGAMAYIVIVNRGRLENLSTRQLVWFVIFTLYGGLTSTGVDNAAHIGGLIGGFLLAAILYRKQRHDYEKGREL